MNRHLSPERISRWMMGEPTPQDEEHVRDCCTCSAEVTRMETALGLFQRSAKDLSRQHSPEFRNVWSAERARHGFGVQALRWALAGVTLLLLAGIPLQTIRENRQREAQIDAALLEQVDAEVSRAVPATMEPLARLIPWGSGDPQNSK
jgi:predicted anti-sigma-YlaC factor YlaD